MTGFPKWVQRAPDIGAVLVLDEDEERALLDGFSRTEQTAESAPVEQQQETDAPIRRGPGRPRKER